MPTAAEPPSLRMLTAAAWGATAVLATAAAVAAGSGAGVQARWWSTSRPAAPECECTRGEPCPNRLSL